MLPLPFDSLRLRAAKLYKCIPMHVRRSKHKCVRFILSSLAGIRLIFCHIHCARTCLL